MFTIERFHGGGDCQIRLSSTGRADAKRQIVFLNMLHILGLVGAPRSYEFSPCLNRKLVNIPITRSARPWRLLIHDGLLQVNVDTFRIKMFAARKFEQRLEHVAAHFCRTRLAGNAKAIAATRNLDIETLFYLPQVFIKLTAEICEAIIVGRLKDDVLGDMQCSIQDSFRLRRDQLVCKAAAKRIRQGLSYRDFDELADE